MTLKVQLQPSIIVYILIFKLSFIFTFTIAIFINSLPKSIDITALNPATIKIKEKSVINRTVRH